MLRSRSTLRNRDSCPLLSDKLSFYYNRFDVNSKLLQELITLTESEDFEVGMLLTQRRKPVYQPKVVELLMDMVSERMPFHQMSLTLFEIGITNSYGEPLSMQTIHTVIERIRDIYPHYNN